MMQATVRRIVICLVTLSATSCDPLEVSDPTAIEEEEVASFTGADHLRRSALQQFNMSLNTTVRSSGLLTDELLVTGIASSELLDRRDGKQWEMDPNGRSSASPYGEWQRTRVIVAAALETIRTYAPEPPRGEWIGQMLGLRGHATLRMADDICPGFPLRELVNGEPVYGPPLSSDEVLERAVMDFDSAIAYAVDSANIHHFAGIGLGRALLSRGQFNEAAEAVSAVPTSYVHHAHYGTGSYGNLLSLASGGLFYSVANREGDNGVDFVDANDPRLQTTLAGTADDSVTEIYEIDKYPDESAPIIVASGVEARLIEAEALLRAEDPGWLEVLNQLRASEIDPPLAPLEDPGTPDERVDVLFRERAFWLFGTGLRLADLQRLIQHYGRNTEDVFPTGTYHRGGLYDTATRIPFSPDSDAPFNPAVTGCTSR